MAQYSALRVISFVLESIVIKPGPLNGPMFGLPFSSSTRFQTMMHFIQLRTEFAAPTPARAIAAVYCGSRRGWLAAAPAGSGPAPPGAPAPNVMGPTSEKVASKPPSVEYMFLFGNRSEERRVGKEC